MERCTIELHNADCMEIMARYPDGYFDLAIVDPPYGIGISKSGGYYHVAGKGQANPHAKKNWDNAIPNISYFQELQRVCSERIVWGGNYFTEFLHPSRCWIFWDKMKYVSNYADGELAWCSFDQNMRTVKIQHHGFLNSDGRSIHPTQKPVELYKWLYANYAKPGMKILDTHLGSGSNAIAAYDMDMALFVGCELDPDYYAAAKARIEQHCNQQRLF